MFFFFFFCSANYKGLTLPWPLTTTSAEERNADLIKEQGNHLLLEFTALLG